MNEPVSALQATPGAPAAIVPAKIAPAAPTGGLPVAGAAATTVLPPGSPPVNGYWPDGLDQALRGTDEKTTLDNLAGALKGYRDRDAVRDVVKTADEMFEFDKIKDFKIDDRNKAHFELLKTDPVFKPMAEVAIKEGVGRGAVMRIYQAGLNASAEAGLLEAPLDAKAELAALVPDAARGLPQADQDTAVQRRLTENYDFLTLMQTNRGLPKEVSEYAELMIGDSAKGHRFFEWVRGLVQGGGQGPGAHGAGGVGTTRESLRAEMAALKSTDLDYAAKHKALEDRYKAMYGE